jgi:hypothetical protein
MPSTAYDMGRNDYVLGNAMSDNRFKASSHAYQMWQQGWIDGVNADPLIDADERAALLGTEVDAAVA